MCPLEIQFKTHMMVENSQGGKQTEVNDLGMSTRSAGWLQWVSSLDQPPGDPKYCHHKNPAFSSPSSQAKIENAS